MVGVAESVTVVQFNSPAVVQTAFRTLEAFILPAIPIFLLIFISVVKYGVIVGPEMLSILVRLKIDPPWNKYSTLPLLVLIPIGACPFWVCRGDTASICATFHPLEYHEKLAYPELEPVDVTNGSPVVYLSMAAPHG
jgi:hypothetical protein